MKKNYKNDRITSAIKIKEDDEEDTVAENDNIAAQENSVDNIALTNEVDVTSGEVAETDITPENVE
jgi:hypothetical protein